VNEVMARVVGLILLMVFPMVNHMLPSGPAVIPPQLVFLISVMA
jgi:hypothetical protein